MARLTIVALAALVVCCLLTLSAEAGSFGDCPSPSQHTQCAGKCMQDPDCSHMGGKCCPNICNFRSCVLPKAANAANNGYKGSSTGSAYCGNVKCSPFEKCGMDRTTKRMMCVRS